MKPYFKFCMLCSIVLITFVTTTKLNMSVKNKLKNTVDVGSVKENMDNTMTFSSANFIEKSSTVGEGDLFETLSIGLTPTVNINEGNFDITNDNVDPGFIKPKIVNFIHKKEKLLDNKKPDNLGRSVFEKVGFFQPIIAAKSEKKVELKENRVEIETPKLVKYLKKENPVKAPGIPKTFHPVQMVKELSPTAKKDLELRDHFGSDGWGSPEMVHSVIEKSLTPIANIPIVDYKWSHPAADKDKNLWQNVEFNRYGNDITHHWSSVPAKFTVDELGQNRVHSPPGESMEIHSAKSSTIYSTKLK